MSCNTSLQLNFCYTAHTGDECLQ